MTSAASSTPKQQLITACAFIHRKIDGIEKIFLPKRAATKAFMPGVFELPGGHVEYGEDIVVGLEREIAEEFHMAANVGDPFFVFTYVNAAKGAHSVEVIYFVTFTQDPANVKLNPQDHSEFGWFTEDELSGVMDNGAELAAMRKGFALLRGESPQF